METTLKDLSSSGSQDCTLTYGKERGVKRLISEGIAMCMIQSRMYSIRTIKLDLYQQMTIIGDILNSYSSDIFIHYFQSILICCVR